MRTDGRTDRQADRREEANSIFFLATLQMQLNNNYMIKNICVMQSEAAITSKDVH